MQKSAIHALLQRPIAYHPVVAKAFGSAKLAIFWSQFYYWSDRTQDPDGWVYKSAEDIFEETGLSRREQETCRKLAKEMGVMDEKRRRMPAVMHYRVNLEATARLVEQYAAANNGGTLFPVDTPKKDVKAARVKAAHNPLGAEIIKAFEAVDPKNKTYYGNKSQRASCDFLIEEYGLAKVLEVVAILPKTNTLSYIPSIKSPYELKEKWSKLADALSKKKKEMTGAGKGRGIA